MIPLDWIAPVLGLAGAYLVPSKKRKHRMIGWILYVLCSCLWLYIGLDAQIYGMAVGALGYFVLEFRGLYKEIKKKRKT